MTGGLDCHRVMVQARRQLEVRGHRLIPGDQLARLGGHAAEDAGHGGLRAALGLVVGLVLADGLEQQVVLALVRIARRPLVIPDQAFGRLLVALVEAGMADPFAEDGRALGAVDDARPRSPSSRRCAGLGPYIRVPSGKVYSTA